MSSAEETKLAVAETAGASSSGTASVVQQPEVEKITLLSSDGKASETKIAVAEMAGASSSSSAVPVVNASASSSRAVPVVTAGASSSSSAAPVVQDPEEEGEKITLLSSDGMEFHVSVAVAQQSAFLKNIIEDGCAGNGVPLPNVDSITLTTVLDYMNTRHRIKHPVDTYRFAPPEEQRGKPEEFKKFEAELLAKLDQPELFYVILAANYLDIRELMDASCQIVADAMCKMTPEEIRKNYGIKNDFTPEEEAEVRRETAWAHEPLPTNDQ